MQLPYIKTIFAGSEQTSKLMSAETMEASLNKPESKSKKFCVTGIIIAVIVLIFSLLAYLVLAKVFYFEEKNKVPDPCSLNNGECSQFCSGETKPQCSCREGFELGSDRRTCVDADECSKKIDPCNDEGKVCVNTIGSYSCQLLNCEHLQIGLKNYYKSNVCCLALGDFSINVTNNRSQKTLLKRPTIATQWPWKALVLGSEHRCGAVIIARNWLLSSALCTKSFGNSLIIFLGERENVELNQLVGSSNVKTKVKKVVVHPDSTNNDVALLQLSDEIHFNELIQPIQLPCGESPQEGTTCYVTGYGEINLRSDVKNFSMKLLSKEVSAPIVPSFFCEHLYRTSNIKFNSSAMVCAGDLREREDLCRGTYTGEPLVCQRSTSCQWYLSGMNLFGKSCGTSNYPGVYTKILKYEKWIRKILKADKIDVCQ